MLSVKIIAAIVLATSLISGSPSACRSNGISQGNKTVRQTNDKNSTGDVKTIVEGFQCSVTMPFVGVIRDPETYAVVRKQAANIPEIASEFFKSNVVIAAFLGTRNTGGYSVEISREADGQIRVAENAPGKGMMVPQMVTSPFKVVSVATNGTPAIQLSLDERFKQNAQLYRISKGTFTISGGFAGRSESYQLNGKLQVTRLGNLITVGFALMSGGTSRERALRDAATGLIKENGFEISRTSHGSLLDPPSGDLRVSGKFVEKNRIILDLDSGPATVPDGYAGKGSIEAELVAASAN
jgi:hypothetical protein